MRVCISNKYGTWTNAGTGKGFFAQRLIKALRGLGVDVTDSPTGYHKSDIDLQFGKYIYAPNARKSIIRFGPSHFGIEHHRQNKPKRNAMKLAGAVIYQSSFGKRMCDAFLGDFKRGPTRIIVNGAEKIEHKPKSNPCFVASTRNWAKQKRLKDILRAFILADIPDSEMIVMGQCKPRIADGRIKYLGLCGQDRVIDELRRATAMVSIVWLDCMPNSACEALCAGCNVITTSASGTPEIAPNLVLHEKPWNFKATDQNDPPGVDIVALAELMRRSLEVEVPNCSHVDIRNIAKQYLDFFEEVLSGRN